MSAFVTVEVLNVKSAIIISRDKNSITSEHCCTSVNAYRYLLPVVEAPYPGYIEPVTLVISFYIIVIHIGFSSLSK